jgi:hypothetical protein
MDGNGSADREVSFSAPLRLALLDWCLDRLVRDVNHVIQDGLHAHVGIGWSFLCWFFHRRQDNVPTERNGNVFSK